MRNPPLTRSFLARSVGANEPEVASRGDCLTELKQHLGLDPDEICLELEVLRVIANAGIAQSLAYAFWRTGIILTAENRHLFSKNDLQNWEDALDEYQRYAKGNEEDAATSRLLTEGL